MTTNMTEDIAKAEELLKGKRYSLTFLAMIAAKNWAGVEELYVEQEDHFHGKWSGCPQDTETLRHLAAADGYEITKW